MELLIRVVDKPGAPDNPLVSAAGDVIAICPDGWAWSEAELTNPEWRIVKCPLLAIERDALLASSPAEALVKRRRVKRLGLADHPLLKAFIARQRVRGEMQTMTRVAVNGIVKVLA